MATAILATEELRNTVSQVPPFSPNEITAMVKQRTTVDATELASYTRTLIGTKMRDVLIARPLLKEVKRRFTILPREKQVDGTYLEIDGATSFEKWCEKHEKFIGSSRNAYYILNGGNKNRTPKPPSARRGAPWTKMEDGANAFEAFSTVQKSIRRCAAPGDEHEQRAIDFTKRLYAHGWDVWKRLKIVASEDIGLADLSVSQEVSRLWEVSKTVKDAKHSDLLMLIEAVAICCRAKKSRAIDNAINWKPTYTAMTDTEAKQAVDDTTVHAVPDFANDGLHTGAKHDGTVISFLVNEDAALGNRGDIAEVYGTPTFPSHTITQRADGLFYDENGIEWIQVVTVKPTGDPDPEPPKPKKTNKTKSPRVEVSEPKPPDWQHRSLLPESEATAWYETCSVLPQWTDCGDGLGDFDRKAINFGTAYGHDGLKNSDGVEYPIEDWMLPLIETVCKCPDVMAPCNYVQCHWIGPLGCVLPHRDPAGMYVPMLCLGHGRVFRVGGKMPQGYYRIAKRHRKIERHIPAEEILCSHGDLLTFIGGKTLHSMFPVAQDPRFVAGAFDHRISLLFRWTTPAMREFGPGDAARKAGHNKQYQEAVESYRNGLTDFLGREVKS